MIRLTAEPKPTDSAFLPIGIMPPLTNRAKVIGWMRWLLGAPDALILKIGTVWAKQELSERSGDGPICILGKDPKAYIFTFLDLPELYAASLVSKEWNGIIGTYSEIWESIAHRMKLQLKKDMGFRLQTVQFMREVQQTVKASTRYLDLTKVVKVKGPKISDLKMMAKLVIARDILLVWDCLAQEVALERPGLENLKTPKEICDKAKEFDAWVRGNRAALDWITDLKLGAYYLNSLPNVVCSMTNLLKLSLANNNLTELPEAIGMLTQIQKLNLNFNKLKKLPIELNKLTNLQELQILGNRINNIPSDIRALPNLRWFIIGNNPLPIYIRVSTAINTFSRYILPFAGCMGVLTSIDAIRIHGVSIEALVDSFSWSLFFYSAGILTLSLDYPLHLSLGISYGMASTLSMGPMGLYQLVTWLKG